MAAQSFPRSTMTWAAVSTWAHGRTKKENTSACHRSTSHVHLQSRGLKGRVILALQSSGLCKMRSTEEKNRAERCHCGNKETSATRGSARREKPAKGSEQLPSHRSVVIELLRLEAQKMFAPDGVSNCASSKGEGMLATGWGCSVFGSWS